MFQTYWKEVINQQFVEKRRMEKKRTNKQMKKEEHGIDNLMKAKKFPKV